jgi:hypothetical protein
LRLPDDPADPLSVLSSTLQNFRQAHRSGADGRYLDVQLVALDLKAQRYDMVIHRVRDADELSSPLLCVYGLLAALAMKDEIHEPYFLLALRSCVCYAMDQPHYYHVIDEITFLRGGGPCRGLLRLVMDNTERLMHNMKYLHVVPLLGCTENAFVFKKQQAHDIFRGTWHFLPGADLPQLAPVAEGFDIDGPVDESKDIGQLIANRQFQMVVIKCSRLLRLHPNRAELFVHRSLALVAMGKDADALLDVEKALAIDKVDEVVKLRDTLLRRMGISDRYLDGQKPWDDSRPMPPVLFASERHTRK